MEKTYKRVPFDIELAKKIQSGEVEGRIITKNNLPVLLKVNAELNTLISVNRYNDYLEIQYKDLNYLELVCYKDYLFIELPEETPKQLDTLIKDNKDIIRDKITDADREVAKKIFSDSLNMQSAFITGVAYERCKYTINSPKHEFKVGDKVRVIKLPFDSMFDGAYLGKEFVIKEVKTTIVGDYTVGKEGWKDNNFPADCLELVNVGNYEFKPFDHVLVRDINGYWVPRLYEMYSGGTEKYYCQDGKGYTDILPYEGNEHLVGTTNKPKEE